jgi:hypothetical protein
VEETSTSYRDLTDGGQPAGDGAAGGMTSLAAATAAIISARWSSRGSDRQSAADPIAVNGHRRRDVQAPDRGRPGDRDGHGANGHSHNGHGPNGVPQNGHSAPTDTAFTTHNGHHETAPFPPHPYPPDGDGLPHRVRGSAAVEPGGPRSLFEAAPAPSAPPIFEPAPGFEPPSGFDALTGLGPPAEEAPTGFDSLRGFGPPAAFEPTNGPEPPAPGWSLFEPRSAPVRPTDQPRPQTYTPPRELYPGEAYPELAAPPMADAAYAAPGAYPSITDDEFSGSVMSGLRLPAPFEPEPYEAYDPFEPKPRTTPFDPLDIDTEPMLPQRVPAEPDVPMLVLSPNDPLSDPATATMSEPRQLTRIAQALREDDGVPADHRPDGFDLDAVLDAVRGVPDVSDAHLRWNPDSGHTLRIEFKDGVDEGQVTRRVVQLLRESLGLAAAPNAAAEPLERTGPGPDQSGGGRVRASASVVAPRVSQENQRGTARPLPPARRSDGSLADLPRVVVDHVQLSTLGHDATLEVRLAVSRDGVRAEATSVGTSRGPAVDAYLLRLAAQAAGDAVDRLLVDAATGQPKGRTFVEHATVVPFGGCEVAVVVLLLVGGPNPEQLSGSTIVAGDPVKAVVRATLSALNRRLESLLS